MTAEARPETARAARERARGTVLVTHPSPDLYGSDRVLLESVAGLVAAGWDTVVTVPTTGPLVPELEARGARVELCPTPVLRKALLRPAGLLRLVRDLPVAVVRGLRLLRRVRPDAVYVNTVTVPLWITLARLRRRPVLCHVHEAEGSAPRWLRIALAAPLRPATEVVANSRYSIGVLATGSARVARRARLLPNAVPGPDEPVPARDDVAAPRVLYVGRLSPRKGVDVAVEAVALLRERGVPAELDVLGAVFPGYEWYAEELRGRVAELDLGPAVRWHGFRPDVWPVLAGCDVVVVPSRVDEPFGNTAVEAVLAARPVIASATSGLLEATRGYAAARTVPAGDAAALADAVAALVADWPQVRAAAWADAAVAAERHSPAAYRAAVVDIVEGMVG